MSIVPPEPDSNKTDPLEHDPVVASAFFEGALEALDFAWSAIHVMRFAADEPDFRGPGDFYHGIVKARLEVDKLRAEYRQQRDTDGGA